MLDTISLKNRRVVLENPIPEEERSQSGLWLPATRKRSPTNVSTVLLVAKDCEEVSQGDTVLFHEDLKETIGEDAFDESYTVVPESAILCKVIS